MKEHFSTVLRIYKWAGIVFLFAYTVYVTYDDYAFIERMFSQPLSVSDFAMLMGFQLAYAVVYFLAFTICYWIVTVGGR
jgi:hypothetical protein